MTLWLDTESRVPVTVTGAEGTGPHWHGLVSGPTLALTHVQAPLQHLEPFRPLRVSAHQRLGLTLVYRINPRGCRYFDPGTSEEVDSVRLRFTTLGVFHGTQDVPLAQPLIVAAPRRGHCAQPAP
jgi:hypothetical protein